ncbi:glycosyltransferase [Marinobacterium sedimentorum]|uniref:glycosyltransferase n=1 Tax=Marinobacterium sedimentorum TaxID=2927804 RepID=UPI0020C73421|nr:glycosyltransferase [Marinobacterium sedimentorum]MCP8689369.1 glycosyltransferase [Marinobacterium sedimentorum]
MKEDKAPIVLFVYNRPWHTQQTVEALQRNQLASQSELFIYSDAPKNEETKPQVKQVRDYIKTVSGFKTVTIIERDKNWGLAENIIDGVTEIVNMYGRIIVLEDDLVTSPYFLNFMNDALSFYNNEDKVWHISGWNYPIDSEGLDSTFLWHVMNCWGWATWRDRWRGFIKNPEQLIASWDKDKVYEFNLYGKQDFWSQVQANSNGSLNTWAVFWYSSIFQNGGLCLNPVKTYVENIGLDGSGENCGNNNELNSRLSDVICSDFESCLFENENALAKVLQLLDELNSKSIRCFLSRASKGFKRVIKGLK